MNLLKFPRIIMLSEIRLSMTSPLSNIDKYTFIALPRISIMHGDDVGVVGFLLSAVCINFYRA